MADLAAAFGALLAARRDEVKALEGIVKALSAKPGDEWVDQDNSPLGRRAHLRAVRAGKLPGRRVGKRVLVSRADLDAYILAHAPTEAPSTVDPDAELDARMAIRRRARR